MGMLLLGFAFCLAQNIHICIDSSANGYTLFMQSHESIAFSQILDTIQVVNRGFAYSGNLNITLIPGNLSSWQTEINYYNGALGPARYPGSMVGNRRYICFPYLISNNSGGMGAQNDNVLVDVGFGDVNTEKVIGKELNNRLIFIGVTTEHAIIYRTWDTTLTVFIDSGTIASGVSFWGFDANAGIASVFYSDTISDTIVYYRTTTDGINWSIPQQWYLALPPEFSSLSWQQMALTDNSEPRLVFATLDNNNYYYICVSYSSGVPPVSLISVKDTLCFYSTIATGGNYCAVLYARYRTIQQGFNNWTDFYIVWSTDNGITWGTPINCTAALGYNPGLPQLAKRIDVSRSRAYYIFCAHIANNDDPYWTLLYGTPTPVRIYMGANSYTGIVEDKKVNIMDERIRLNLYPNPFTTKLDIRYEIPDGTKFNSERSEESHSSVSLKIYDATGRLVRQFNHLTNYQYNYVLWYGDDDSGRKLPTGVYFVRLENEGFKQVEKVILLR